MTHVVAFGEIMGRLAPAGNLRFCQSIPGNLEVSFGGAEANVAVSLARFGRRASFVTALPRNDIADACIANLRGVGVDTSSIVRTEVGRLGLFFLETGANQRPSKVIYDRDGASVAITPADRYPWKDIFREADWFHVTGITAAISKVAAEATLTAVKEAKSHQVMVSCDLNFRKNLWRWDPSTPSRELAERTMREILAFVDVVFANEEDASDVLSIQPKDTDVQAGVLAIDRYGDVAREIAAQFPNVSWVAITLRESISASHNNWGAMLYDVSSHTPFFAPTRDGDYVPYEIRNIVDRVGGGDSFAAALIFAMTTPELADPGTAVSFATASSCLAHSIAGDYKFSTRAEVEALMKGSGTGRVVR